MRCLHIHSDGQQCPSAAIEQEQFCVDHLPLDHVEPVEFDERIELPFVYRLARRLGAVLLLGLLLLQLIVSLRMLYGW